ncbi:recombinase family protein [Sulfurovum sp. CS9]|uniref:recombinase family protein n=1 Tax=Sulfurovum sp. CS9 TaxID=3391146 RepID=UPI0039EB899D
MTTVGYTRVSTQTQDTDNQRQEILNYAFTHKLTIDDIIETTISSKKSTKERGIDAVLERLSSGDSLIVTKLDRIGRSTIEVLQIIQDIKDKGITLYIIKDSLIVNPNDTNPITQMFLTLLSGFAQMERSFISERTKSALQARKDKGIKLGRQKGQVVSSKYDIHKEKIQELYDLGVPISKIIDYIGTGTRQSLNNYIKTRGLLSQ